MKAGLIVKIARYLEGLTDPSGPLSHRNTGGCQSEKGRDPLYGCDACNAEDLRQEIQREEGV